VSDPAMATASGPFALLLRRLRLAAGLTQEALAERAGLSDRAISALERGVNRQPHLETVQLLATALNLSLQQRAAFLAAARPESLPAPPPPAGTLTFLLTDVEGSTALWEQHEALMRAVLARLDALLDELLVRHAGHRIKERGEGDGLFAVFADPAAAVAAALAIQQALLAEPWPVQTPIRVRMGLHTGIAQLHGGDYYGPVVNRAARLRELGYGGQVLLAEATAALVASRLVTLTGTGGVGKTRLALAVAGELVEAYADGVWLVELAGLRADTLVAGAVASALGVREEPGRDLPATLTDQLREKLLLLVLDNCEHLVGACASLADALLRACAGLRLLATSREGLGVAGERLYRVPSLPVPDPTALPLAELGQVAAVRLFLERAGAQAAGFALTGENAGVVAGICRRLEGIPLAIELAAGRVGGLPLAAIAARLDQSLRLLTGGARTAATRQQTLRGALGWSWELLEEPERMLLRRLAVFAGGWTLEAAEAVCAGEELAQWKMADLLGALVNKSLVLLEEHARAEGRYRLLEPVRQYTGEKLTASGEEAAVRGRQLAWCVALAEEAEPALTGAGQVVWLERLEAEHDNLRAALTWARDRGEGDLGLRLAGALWRFWHIRGHLGAGRSWLEALLTRPQRVDAGDEASSVRAKALHGLGVLFDVGGDPFRARPHFEESMALRRTVGDHAGIAASLNVLGNLARGQGDLMAARPLYEESLALRRDIGRMADVAASLLSLGSLAWEQGDYDRAQVFCEEGLAIARDLGDRSGVALLLLTLGAVASMQGAYGRATALFEQSLAAHQELGHTWGVAAVRNNLGEVALLQGQHQRAAALFEESLTMKRTLGNTEGVAGSLANLGCVALIQHDYERALALYQESLGLFHRLGLKTSVPLCLDGIATALVGHRDTAVPPPRERALRATRLYAAAAAYREIVGYPPRPIERIIYQSSVARACAALGGDAFAGAWAAGQALSLEDAIAEALILG
jgi:predicted ATPase/transcriptional regulator with XRE-family HTH domain